MNEGGQPPCGAELANFVYLLAKQGTSDGLVLYRFAPATLELAQVAAVDCPAVESSSPSATVDRNSRIWLTKPSGEVYEVPLAGGSCTQLTGADVEPISDYNVRSVAFSADAPGAEAETLFSISARTTGEPSYFRGTDPQTLVTTPIATLSPGDGPIAVGPGWGRTPILTGTGDGKLFSLSQPYGSDGGTLLAQIDKATGKQAGVDGQFESEFAHSHGAAFAFWGGDFWVFTHHQATANTKYYMQLAVTRYRPADATASVVAVFDDIRPLGAGVSTCAPIIPPS